MDFYNDFEPFACEWLGNLIEAKELPQGDVDGRSIKEIKGSELGKYRSCHFFAGIGGWPYAFRLAGWPIDDVPVWSGSCPCQPYSNAGKRKGNADERNLWPDFFRLIRERRPQYVFGEQVPGSIGHGWLDGISADLEAEGYAVGSCVLGAHSVGSPHIRQRLYWAAFHNNRMADLHGTRCKGKIDEMRRLDIGSAWDEYRIIDCRDEKSRRVGSRVSPLAHGLSRKLGQRIPELRGVLPSARRNRTGRLKGYGNAICPQTAAVFIRAFMETQGL